MIQDTRLRGKIGMINLVITRRNFYLRREAKLKNDWRLITTPLII